MSFGDCIDKGLQDLEASKFGKLPGYRSSQSVPV